MKENKGVTLIALVITIIVLLILAGISLAMLSGQNGLLSKSSEAGTKTQVAEAIENVKMAISGCMSKATIESKGTVPTSLAIGDIVTEIKGLNGFDDDEHVSGASHTITYTTSQDTVIEIELEDDNMSIKTVTSGGETYTEMAND